MLNYRNSVFVLSVAFVGMASAYAVAQTVEPGSKELARAQLEVTRPLSHIKLDSAQKVQVKEILAVRKHSDEAFESQHNGDKAAINAFKDDQTRIAIGELKSVLTPSQWEQFTAAQYADAIKETEKHRTEVVVVKTVPASTAPTVTVVELPASVHVEHRKEKVLIEAIKRKQTHTVKIHRAVNSRRKPAKKPVLHAKTQAKPQAK